MHELSIAMSMLEVVAEEVDKHGYARVRGIHLRLGPLSGVAEEALRGAFEIARASSPFPDVELIVKTVPIMIECPVCKSTRSVVSLQELCCEKCGAFTSDIVGGRELEVIALEIE